jgi:hypothetical protein
VTAPSAAKPFVIDPSAVLDYLIDWSPWLPEDDIITASTFTATGVPEGCLTVESDEFTDTTTKVWVAGVFLGKASVVNHITTQGGRQTDWTLKFTVKDV